MTRPGAPPVDDIEDSEFPPDRVRDAPEIARRALALFAVVALSFRAPRDDTLAWLRAESLWDELTPEELAFVSAEAPTKKQSIDASWRSEALLVLLWALGKVDPIPGAGAECEAGMFKAILPPFADLEVSDFIASATRRSDETLHRMAGESLHAHWRVRDAHSRGKAVPPDLNAGVVRERHHAINWVVGYEGSPWDEVASDT